MCAPLSCALFRTCTAQKITFYHLFRGFSYTIIGAVLGQAGGAAATLFTTRPAQLVPLALVILFLAMAFGFDRNVPQPRLLSHLIAGMRGRRAGGALLGFLTPLIPCGPLYLMFTVTLLTGSWLRGAILMACFALGTMPLYLLAQWQWFHLRARMSPVGMRKIQKALACASAGIVTWRALAGGGLGLASPLCH